MWSDSRLPMQVGERYYDGARLQPYDTHCQSLRDGAEIGRVCPIPQKPDCVGVVAGQQRNHHRSEAMTLKQRLCLSAAAIGVLAFAAPPPTQLGAQTAVAIDNDDIGGVVTGANGPQAGVGVIAETSDLPTRYAKMVVTDDQGRYVLPDLPKAKYKVWVRGYGLVDSTKADGEPGQQLNLRAVPAPNEAAAAQYYPAIYWYSMLRIPDTSEFGGKSNIPEKMTQVDWLKQAKNIGCIGCHQLGQLSTRTVPAAFGEFKSG